MAKTSYVMKRIATAERNRCRNKVYKSTIKTLKKKYLEKIHRSSPSQDAQIMLNKVYSKMDKAVKRGILHKNSAARKKVFFG